MHEMLFEVITSLRRESLRRHYVAGESPGYVVATL